jgi:hypothetical protein
MKICCKEMRKEMEEASTQNQECGCPFLQPSLHILTHAFLAKPSAL